VSDVPDVARSLTVRATEALGWAGAAAVVARDSGAQALGWCVLLRVLAGATAWAVTAGLPGGVSVALARGDRRDGPLRAAILVLLVVGSAAGALLWALVMPYAGEALLEGLPRDTVVLASVLVVSRLLATTAQAWLGEVAVLRVAEGWVFLTAYLALGTSAAPTTRLVLALLAADVVTGVTAWICLVRRRALAGVLRRPAFLPLLPVLLRAMVRRPDQRLERVARWLDVVLVALLTDPATLGVYVAARALAELLRVPALATDLVVYPVLRREGVRQGAAQVPHLVRGAFRVSMGCAALALAVAPVVLPGLLGSDLRGSVLVASLLAVGLVADGPAAVLRVWFATAGRPDRSLRADSAGVAVLLLTGPLLVGQLGARGAAVAVGLKGLASLVVLWRGYRAVAGGSGVRLLLQAAPGPQMHVA
jgi:O-antigen/teichoic acid export membrane protein